VLAARERTVGDALAAPFSRLWAELGRAAPGAAAHPRATLAVTAAAVGGGSWYYARRAPGAGRLRGGTLRVM